MKILDNRKQTENVLLAFHGNLMDATFLFEQLEATNKKIRLICPDYLAGKTIEMIVEEILVYLNNQQINELYIYGISDGVSYARYFQSKQNNLKIKAVFFSHYPQNDQAIFDDLHMLQVFLVFVPDSIIRKKFSKKISDMTEDLTMKTAIRQLFMKTRLNKKKIIQGIKLQQVLLKQTITITEARQLYLLRQNDYLQVEALKLEYQTVTIVEEVLSDYWEDVLTKSVWEQIMQKIESEVKK